MCGISGIANWQHPVLLENYYQAHLELRHRGLDGEGFFLVRGNEQLHLRGGDSIPELSALPHIEAERAANVVLGHRRLSIIDLSAAGHQPMVSQTGRYTMVYNGEIYNYLELREELRRLGAEFRSESDSEVILVALEYWGERCFARFNGMWAIVVYDAQERRLILCRDRFGIKPLYYSLIGQTLYFASEAKFLLNYVPARQYRPDRVIEYLVHNVTDHHEESMFAGVNQLQPAHWAIFDEQGLRTERYWQLPARTQPARFDLAGAVAQLRELLQSAVQLRLRSDVPVGSLLSGGLDSTVIVCLACALLDQQGDDAGFDFFSAVFREQAYSERPYIEDTVAQTGRSIHWIYPDPNALAAQLDQMLYHQEFPFRSLSVFSQWTIMHDVGRTPIKVLLNGQGSDELFGGYTAHYYALIAEYLRRWQPLTAWRQLSSIVHARQMRLPQALASTANQLVKVSTLGNRFAHRELPYLNQPYRPANGWERDPDIFHDMLVRNLTFSALPEYLRYEDRNSMAATLESRLPFLDYRLVEWAMQLPMDMKIEGDVSKRVLREMAQPLIPASVSQRTDKMGFVSPQPVWQRDMLAPLIAEAFQADLPARFPFLVGAELQKHYEDYQAGRHDDWAWVWRVACLYYWHRAWWGE